jgi:hypothetical protein
MPAIQLDIASLIADAETSSAGGGVFAANVPQGLTLILPVRDPRIQPDDRTNKAGVYAPATDYGLDDGKPRSKRIYLGVVLFSNDPKYFPRGWDGNFAEASEDIRSKAAAMPNSRLVVPFALAKQVGEAYLQLFQPPKADAGGLLASTVASFLEVDAANGKFEYEPSLHYPIALTRTGEKLTTKYAATVVSNVTPDMQKLIRSIGGLVLPPLPLPELAADYTAYRKAKLAEKATAPAAAPATPPPASSVDFLSALGL